MCIGFSTHAATWLSVPHVRVIRMRVLSLDWVKSVGAAVLAEVHRMASELWVRVIGLAARALMVGGKCVGTSM